VSKTERIRTTPNRHEALGRITSSKKHSSAREDVVDSSQDMPVALGAPTQERHSYELRQGYELMIERKEGAVKKDTPVKTQLSQRMWEI
jgi:hypothetical protein